MKTRYFENCRTAEELKQEYKRLAKKLHPDCNKDRDTTKEFQALKNEFDAAWERLKDVHENKDGQKYTSSTATKETAGEFMDTIDALLKYKGIKIELCGTWLWVTGDTYPIRDTLKGLSFQYSRKKKAWYYHPEEYRKKKKGSLSMEKIRFLYGSEVFADSEKQDSVKIAAMA